MHKTSIKLLFCVIILSAWQLFAMGSKSKEELPDAKQHEYGIAEEDNYPLQIMHNKSLAELLVKRFPGFFKEEVKKTNTVQQKNLDNNNFASTILLLKISVVIGAAWIVFILTR